MNRFLIVGLGVLFAATGVSAADYTNCDVDIGCSDEVADYQNVKVREISLADFRHLYESNEAYALIDVRPESSFKARHIKGARSLFVARASTQEIKSVLPDQEERIVVYCSNSRCPMSQHAAQLLVFLGYKNVVNFKGGLEEWFRNGLPVESAVAPFMVPAAANGS